MTTYPRYRVSQWIDTSEEAMNQPEARFVYGVQAQSAPRAKWLHCVRDNAVMLFKTPEEASAEILALQQATTCSCRAS